MDHFIFSNRGIPIYTTSTVVAVVFDTVQYRTQNKKHANKKARLRFRGKYEIRESLY